MKNKTIKIVINFMVASVVVVTFAVLIAVVFCNVILGVNV
jgi:hypothetical protein